MPLTKFRGIVVFNLIYMTEKKVEFSYEEFNDSSELNEADALLLNEARKVTVDAYAPYSNFHVGAIALLENGEIAISYNSKEVKSDHPISPCGMCRQALLEYETRTEKPIRIILSGQEGKVFIINTVKYLLPFAFTKSELK